jgi:hypothetical protein
MCNCGEPIKAKGLCSKHYLADYRQRKLQGLIKKTPLIDLVEATYKDTPNCGVCGEPKRAKNLCTKHYFQLRRGTND